MSLWQHNHIFTGLESDRATLVLRRGNTTVRQQSVAVAPSLETSLVSALGVLLMEQPLAARRLDIVVSDSYARYLVFDIAPGLRDVAELRAMVATLFEERFGERVQDWHVVLDVPPGADGGVACGLPRALLDGCVQAAGAVGIKRVRVQPYFAVATRRDDGRNEEQGWVAARADGQVTLGNFQRGRWRSLRTMAATPDDAPELLVARECLRLGIDPPAAAVASGVGSWPGQPGVRCDMALAGLPA